MSNADNFALEIDREFAELMGDVREAVVTVGVRALVGLVMKSPVDTGRFRGNWMLSTTAPYSGPEMPADKSGQLTLARGDAELSRYRSREDYPVLYFTNNLPYAGELERGHSLQAPNGMVALTVAEISALWGSLRER